MDTIRKTPTLGNLRGRELTPKALDAAVGAVQVADGQAARSVLVGRNDLATGPRSQGPPRLHSDARLDELDRAVAEQHVDTARVMAAGDVSDLKSRAAAPGVRRHHVDVARIEPAGPTPTSPRRCCRLAIEIGRVLIAV